MSTYVHSRWYSLLCMLWHYVISCLCGTKCHFRWSTNKLLICQLSCNKCDIQFIKSCNHFNKEYYILISVPDYLPLPVTTAKYPRAFIGNSLPSRIDFIWKKFKIKNHQENINKTKGSISKWSNQLLLKTSNFFFLATLYQFV